MTLTLRLAAWFGLSTALSFGRTWLGSLVDSKCYASEERNVNPTDTLTNVDRDGDREIRYCSPNAKAKSFALVGYDGQTYQLDSTGNVRASELVRRTARKKPFHVVITGEMAGKAIQVDSISAAP